ncbi:hypothetical protein EJB05_34925, partial [Eragrostis curvula]
MQKVSSASTLLLLPLVFLLLSIVCMPATGDATQCTPQPCQGKHSSHVLNLEMAVLIWMDLPWTLISEQSWPELVGKDQDTAYNIIKRDNPQVTDIVWLISAVVGHVSEKKDVLGAAGDDDFCCNRVIVVLGALPSGVDGVIKVPVVG